MPKYLIINADDFGMCHAANLATFDLFNKGGITSATVMTPCGWAPEAIAWANANPQHAVGIHLTFTSEWRKYKWRPVSRGPNESLRDETGYMHFHCDTFERDAVASEVEAEIRAQIEFAKDMGLNPSHLDNHMGSLHGDEGGQDFIELVLRICAEYGLAYRMVRRTRPNYPEALNVRLQKIIELADNFGVPFIDELWVHHWNKDLEQSYEAFAAHMNERWNSFPENGIIETLIHPSTASDELANTSGMWFRRVWEYQYFANPDTLRIIRAKGINLISYRDVYGLRGKTQGMVSVN